MNHIKLLVILAINHYTGVSIWARDLILGLSKFEFEIDVLYEASNPEMISNADYNKSLIGHQLWYQLDNAAQYDVAILCNTFNETTALRVAKKTIFVSHSSMVDNVNPKLKHTRHITISGRSCEVLGADTHIVNGIDLKKFSPKRVPQQVPTTCYFHNRVAPQQMVFDACEKLNLNLIWNERITDNITSKLEAADFVMAYGRSAYEAMAMGKPVLIFGHNEDSSVGRDTLLSNGILESTGGLSDGWITKHNFETLLFRNCSGWAEKIFISTSDSLVDMISQYDMSMGKANRTLAEKYLSLNEMIYKFKNEILLASCSV